MNSSTQDNLSDRPEQIAQPIANEAKAATGRWANCGHHASKAWSITWSQLIGIHHPTLTEDDLSHQLQADHLILSLADGVGSGARPEIAAQAANQHAKSLPIHAYVNQNDIKDWMQQAEAAVAAAIVEVSYEMGAATLVSAWIDPDGNGHALRIGDARIYLISPTDIRPLFEDQTYAYTHESPPEGGSEHDPAHMLGCGSMGELELKTIHVPKGHGLLLCSDGLHRGLTDAQMLSILTKSPPEQSANTLSQQAQQNGSHDDISVMIAVRLAKPRGFLHQLWQAFFQK